MDRAVLSQCSSGEWADGRGRWRGGVRAHVRGGSPTCADSGQDVSVPRGAERRSSWKCASESVSYRSATACEGGDEQDIKQDNSSDSRNERAYFKSIQPRALDRSCNAAGLDVCSSTSQPPTRRPQRGRWRWRIPERDSTLTFKHCPTGPRVSSCLHHYCALFVTTVGSRTFAFALADSRAWVLCLADGHYTCAGSNGSVCGHFRCTLRRGVLWYMIRVGEPKTGHSGETGRMWMRLPVC